VRCSATSFPSSAVPARQYTLECLQCLLVGLYFIPDMLFMKYITVIVLTVLLNYLKRLENSRYGQFNKKKI
jgi:hypothetical protein